MTRSSLSITGQPTKGTAGKNENNRRDKTRNEFVQPAGRDSRPITDRVKQSLFDVLQKYDLPAGKTVADLFAGVGSLGLESLSRGATFVTFVEQNPKIVPILEKNIEKAGFAEQSKVIRADAFRIKLSVNAEQSQSATADKYDLVFVDPPYVDSASDTGRLTVSIAVDSFGRTHCARRFRYSPNAPGYYLVAILRLA